MALTFADQPIEHIIFDFDGVLTDNRVWLNALGEESVVCNRSDGLGLQILSRLGINVRILSKEKNKVVEARGIKLGIPVDQGVDRKDVALQEMAKKGSLDLKKTLFVGNDLNDLAAFDVVGWTACPSDAHPEIIKRSHFVLKTPGGHGVVREIASDVLKLSTEKQLEGLYCDTK